MGEEKKALYLPAVLDLVAVADLDAAALVVFVVAVLLTLVGALEGADLVAAALVAAVFVVEALVTLAGAGLVALVALAAGLDFASSDFLATAVAVLEAAFLGGMLGDSTRNRLRGHKRC